MNWLPRTADEGFAMLLTLAAAVSWLAIFFSR